MAVKRGQGKSPGVRGRSSAKARRASDAGGFALPADALRRLVAEITARVGVEPFVARLLPLIDGLRAGRTAETARAARRSKDREFRRLASSISRVAGRGHFVAARNTALLAASFAYQDSLDYVCRFLDYLDAARARRRAPRQSARRAG